MIVLILLFLLLTVFIFDGHITSIFYDGTMKDKLLLQYKLMYKTVGLVENKILFLSWIAYSLLVLQTELDKHK